MKTFLIIAALLLTTGCGTMSQNFELKLDPITTTQNAIAIVGEQTNDTNELYVQGCKFKTIEVSRCNDWRKFFLRFQIEYPVWARAYKAAVAAGDMKSADAAAKSIQALNKELALYFITKGK